MKADSRDAPHGSQWIEWKGGECPVAGDVMVTVRIGSLGESSLPYRADGFSWKHYGSEADIIAYRVCAPLETGAPVQSCAPSTENGQLAERLRKMNIWEEGSETYETIEAAVRALSSAAQTDSHPPASPAATPITLCNGKPCEVAAALVSEVAELRGKLAEAQEAAEQLGQLLQKADQQIDEEQAIAVQQQRRAEAAESALATAKKDERAQALEDALGMLIQADTLEAGMSHIQRALFALGEEA